MITRYILPAIPIVAIATGLFFAFLSRFFGITRQSSANRVLAGCFAVLLGQATYVLFATREALARAEAAHVARQPDVLIREAGRAIDTDPSSAIAYAKRATGYIMKGDCQKALLDVQASLRISTGVAEAYNVRGLCSTDLSARIVDFTSAIDRAPRAYAPYANRSNTFLLAGNLQGALKDIDKAIQLKPGAPRLHMTRAFVLFESGDRAAALKELVDGVFSAHLSDDEASLAYALQAQILMETRDQNGALKSSEEAVKLTPTSPAVYVIRGNAFADLRMYARAIEDYDMAIALDPKTTVAYFERANVWMHLYNPQGALADLGKAIEISPEFISAYSRRADILARQGNIEGARADLRTIDRLTSSGHTSRLIEIGSDQLTPST